MSDVLPYLERQTQAALGRALPRPAIGALYKYLNLLTKWQKSQRLIGSDKPAWIVDNVIVDSVLFTRALPTGIAALADIGSGAGVPGIPLAVVLPDVEVALVEARQKRASFLSAAIRELPLPNCRLLNHRLEDILGQLGGRFDAVVMRCAGHPTSFIAKVGELLTPGGVVVASGPPRRFEVPVGDWLEVDGPNGPRRFWVYHAT